MGANILLPNKLAEEALGLAATEYIKPAAKAALAKKRFVKERSLLSNT